MKLELIRRSERRDYTCYGVKISEDKIWKIYLPTTALSRFPPERFITFVSMQPIDPEKHLCHKCGKLYPKHQYAKHAKRFHK